MHSPRAGLWTIVFLASVSSVPHAQEKPILGLIPKYQPKTEGVKDLEAGGEDAPTIYSDVEGG